ncbi:MAG: hypothetical protein RLZZ241_41 [Bacteroidota bacterium]
MRKLGFKFIFLFLFYGMKPILAQDVPNHFKLLADSIIKIKPVEYKILEDIFHPFTKDSVLLEYVQSKSDLEDYKIGQIFAELALGKLKVFEGNYKLAREHYLICTSISKEIENIYKRTQSFNLIGMHFVEIESIKDALDNFNEAFQLAQIAKDTTLPFLIEINKSQNGIGEVYHLLGQYDLACEQFQKALESNLILNNLEGQALNYQNLGRCSEAQGLNDASFQYYGKAKELNDALGNALFRLVNIAKMAHLKTHFANKNEGLAELLAIYPEAEASSDPELRSRLNNSIGCALNQLGKYREATKYIRRGLAIAQQVNLPRNLDVAYTLLFQNYKATGNYEAALFNYEQAIEVRTQILEQNNNQYVYEAISNAQATKRQEVINDITLENERVNLELRRNRSALMIGGLMIILISFLLYFLYRQFQYNNDRKLNSMEQHVLRSQMNPHFLFNSLNAIKLYIIQNEQNNAINYLNKFSKLIRKILDSSTTKEITLKEELDTVELYLNIENIRFNQSIDFSIDVASDINTSLIKIPSLILQPFLENALWHGLSLKEGHKSLKLKVVRKANSFIQIIIEDNGIGRVAATKLIENRSSKRRSYGISITQERLKNFSRSFPNNFSLEIKDLLNTDGTAAGTCVFLNIPIS